MWALVGMDDIHDSGSLPHHSGEFNVVIAIQRELQVTFSLSSYFLRSNLFRAVWVCFLLSRNIVFSFIALSIRIHGHKRLLDRRSNGMDGLKEQTKG